MFVRNNTYSSFATYNIAKKLVLQILIEMKIKKKTLIIMIDFQFIDKL